MGTIYCGPLTDRIDGDSHEGYAARILPDGTETAVWTYETAEFTGFRAHCGCGWRGTATYAPTERGEDLAVEEWHHDHLQPLIDAEARQHTFTAKRLLDLTRALRRSLPTTVNEDGHELLTERGSGALDVIQQLEDLVDELATEDADDDSDCL